VLSKDSDISDQKRDVEESYIQTICYSKNTSTTKWPTTKDIT
jgi:hypothetical protein